MTSSFQQYTDILASPSCTADVQQLLFKKFIDDPMDISSTEMRHEWVLQCGWLTIADIPILQLHTGSEPSMLHS